MLKGLIGGGLRIEGFRVIFSLWKLWIQLPMITDSQYMIHCNQ